VSSVTWARYKKVNSVCPDSSHITRITATTYLLLRSRCVITLPDGYKTRTFFATRCRFSRITQSVGEHGYFAYLVVPLVSTCRAAVISVAADGHPRSRSLSSVYVLAWTCCNIQHAREGFPQCQLFNQAFNLQVSVNTVKTRHESIHYKPQRR